MKIPLRLLAGLGAVVLPWLGCARPNDKPAEMDRSPAKMPAIAADASIGREPASKPAPVILPFADIPEPQAFTLKQIRDKLPDGAVTIRQVKQFSKGPKINHGPYSELRPDGSKYCRGPYQDGLRTGSWTFWHTGGRVAKSGSYKAGKPEGVWTYWRDDGTKERVETYADGKREGRWLFYYPGGKLSKQEEYKAGNRDGDWVEWYPDGKKQSQNHLAADEVDGVQMLWHRNGRPLRQTEFKRGRRDGRFISWNEQGEKLSELVYRNDVLVRSIE